jgi:hypothetical protein
MLKQETFQNLFFFNKLHDYIYIYKRSSQERL